MIHHWLIFFKSEFFKILCWFCGKKWDNCLDWCPKSRYVFRVIYFQTLCDDAAVSIKICLTGLQETPQKHSKTYLLWKLWWKTSRINLSDRVHFYKAVGSRSKVLIKLNRPSKFTYNFFPEYWKMKLQLLSDSSYHIYNHSKN